MVSNAQVAALYWPTKGQTRRSRCKKKKMVCINSRIHGLNLHSYFISCKVWRHISHLLHFTLHRLGRYPKMTTVEMRVHMDCAGCESKIKKALQKLKGVDSVEIDMAMQKVTVTGWADQKKVLKTVRKTGRRAELWSFPYNPEHNNTANYLGINQHHCNGPLTHFTPQPSSSYNYYKHGYSSHENSYYHRPPHSTIIGDQTAAAFSDENPNACSVM